MALTFLLDEDCFSRALRSAVENHNARGIDPIDITWIGAPEVISCGSDDPNVIRWAADHGRILLSKDRSSLPHALRIFLDEGGHSPGILFLRKGTSVAQLLESLVLIAHAGREEEYANCCGYIPIE